jgi:hypothetical protein
MRARKRTVSAAAARARACNGGGARAYVARRHPAAMSDDVRRPRPRPHSPSAAAGERWPALEQALERAVRTACGGGALAALPTTRDGVFYAMQRDTAKRWPGNADAVPPLVVPLPALDDEGVAREALLRSLVPYVLRVVRTRLQDRRGGCAVSTERGRCVVAVSLERMPALGEVHARAALVLTAETLAHLRRYEDTCDPLWIFPLALAFHHAAAAAATPA